MNSGDQYTYEVIYSPRGFEQVPANAVKLHLFEQAMKDTATAAERVGVAGNRAAGGVKAAGTAADAVRGANNRLATGLMSVTYVMDDIQYGSRSIVNQLPGLVTMFAGTGVAGAALAGGLTILTSVFREQIDAVLASAGILDENLVKAMEKGEAVAGKLSDRIAKLNEQFEESDKQSREAASGIGESFIDAGSEVERRVAEALAALDGGQAEIERKEAELVAKIADLERRRRDAIAGGGQGMPAVVQNLSAEIDRANDEILKLADGLYDKGLPALVELQREAVTSDAALVKLAKAAQAAGEVDLAKSLYSQTEGAKAAAKATEEIAKEVEELDRQRQQAAEADARRAEQEVERRAREAEAAEEAGRRKAEAEEQAQKRMAAAIEEARKAKEREELDEQTQRVLGALGGRFDAGIGQALMGRARAGQEMGAVGVGGASDAVAGQVVQMLVRSGVGIEAARGAAEQLVGEQAAAIQGIVDQNNLTFNLMQTMLNGQGQLGLIQQQHRDRMLMLQRQALQQDQRFRPMRMLQGNNLRGGW